MRINTNLTAMNTHTQYTKNNNNIAKAVEKLSSGYSINSAADNAAGLAISEKMRAQIRGLEQANTNSQDAISLVQTAEGGLNETTEVLQRMRELAVQSANDTNENEIDREALQDEFDQLQLEINSIAKSTSFNKKTVLDGTLAEHHAKTANLNMANSGLSVNLGNVAAGAYAFESVVKVEKAAVEGQTAGFTPITTNPSLSVTSALPVYYEQGPTALPNGNYTIEASYNPDTYELTVAAKGDNGQTFTAVLDKNALDTAVQTDPTHMTLEFKNGTSTAFSYELDYIGSFTTSNASSVATFADLLSDSMSVSASGGVDASEAEYALYATLTGAEDVKLEAGMDSVSFTNGVTVNFDELTTSDVTISAANVANNSRSQATLSATKADGTVASVGVAFTGLAADFTGLTDADIQAAEFQLSDIDYANGTATVKVNLDGTDYTVNNWVMSGNLDLSANGGPVIATSMDDTAFDAVQAAAATTGATSDTTATSAQTLQDFSATYNMKFGKDGSHTDTVSTFEVELAEGDGITFQIGANQGDELKIYIEEMSTEYLGIASASILTRTTASEALTTVDTALNQVASQRAYLGAMQNRLEHKIANLETAAQNLTDAESTIRDVDMAKQMTEFTNANILSQAATAMLAQANSLPQGVLSLLQG